MLFQTKPDDFNPSFEVVSCFMEYRDKILLLHRQDTKPQGNTWGVPAGKLNSKEDKLYGVIREIFQETGFQPKFQEVNYFNKLFVRYPECDFVYHIFSTKLNEKIAVKINLEEHKGFIWISPSKALEIPLIMDLDECIKLFYGSR